MPAQAAPPSVPTTRQSVTCRNGFMPVNEAPTQTASVVPTMYWPWPPMLNMPQRNANATASAVRMIGVVRSSVCCRFCAATEAVSQGNQTVAPLNGNVIE